MSAKSIGSYSILAISIGFFGFLAITGCFSRNACAVLGHAGAAALAALGAPGRLWGLCGLGALATHGKCGWRGDGRSAEQAEGYGCGTAVAEEVHDGSGWLRKDKTRG